MRTPEDNLTTDSRRASREHGSRSPESSRGLTPLAPRLRQLFRDNGLSLVLCLLFVGAFAGQSLVGHRKYNNDQRDHGQPTLSYPGYLASPGFLEAVSENWESELLQWAPSVLLPALPLPARLRPVEQSRRIAEEGDRQGARAPAPSAQLPAPPCATAGCACACTDTRSRSRLFGLFAFSFVLHALSGTLEHNEERRCATTRLSSASGSSSAARPFWFQSLQNWQSEFLSVGLLVLLSIYLRERGSSQSKPVDSAHSETGNH